MKFSIVTPSYNHGEYIEDTIKSVINQTHKDFEYIIIDGGSTDNSGEIISAYSGWLKKYISEKDRGQTDAINKGFKFADGDIYAYLNSDDYYFRNTLEVVSAYFEKHPEVDVIYGDCAFTDARGQFIRYFSEISDFDEDRLRNYSDIIMQPATFWRKRVFEQYGPFDESFHFGFDWAFWCELASKGCRFQRMPAMLAANRVYPQTKTASGSVVRLRELKKINKRYKTRFLLHAYYRYCLADLVDKAGRSLLDYLQLPFFVLLSYGNILHHFGNYHSKIINGLLPNSSALLKRAAIKMPRLDYRSVKISLVVPADVSQAVVVYSSGKKVGHYVFAHGSLNLRVALAGGGNDVDIKLEFESEYPLYKSRIKRAVFFYKPIHIAAQILSVNLC